MKKLSIVLLCLSSLLWKDALFAAEETVRMSYIGRDLKGADRWRAEARIINTSPGVYRMTERGEGVYSSFNGPISWVAEMKFERAEGRVRPMSLDKRVFNAKGRMIRREKQEFDLANNTVTCTHEDPERNISRRRNFKFDKDAVNRLSLGFYVQTMLKSGKTHRRVQMVSEEPAVYDIELKLLGKETVEMNGRKVAAYRLCVEPYLGFFGFAKSVIPKAYAWHSAGPGCEWLRYAGLEGGLMSARVEVTVVDRD